MAQIRKTGAGQADLVKMLRVQANRMLCNPVLAVNSGGAATYKTTVVPTAGAYMINGVLFTLTNASAEAITGTATGAGQTCRYRIEVGTTQAFTEKQGPIVTGAVGTAPTPERSENKATVGFIDIPASFTPGTTALDVAGVAFINGDVDMAVAALEA